MNGRTTKLLLARKKKGVFHKRRPQLGRGGGVKNWLILTIKNDNMGEWDVENSEKLPTWFMDGPKEEGRQNNGKLSRLSTTAH